MKLTEDNGAKYLHFDVMDGMFVPSISFGMPVLKSIHNATDQVMDAHLMVQEPIRYVEAFKEAGADIVTIHLEACEDVNATIAKIRECGMKVGLSICPETPADLTGRGISRRTAFLSPQPSTRTKTATPSAFRSSPPARAVRATYRSALPASAARPCRRRFPKGRPDCCAVCFSATAPSFPTTTRCPFA